MRRDRYLGKERISCRLNDRESLFSMYPCFSWGVKIKFDRVAWAGCLGWNPGNRQRVTEFRATRQERPNDKKKKKSLGQKSARDRPVTDCLRLQGMEEWRNGPAVMKGDERCMREVRNCSK